MNKQISIIVPTLNEHENIIPLAERIDKSLSENKIMYEIIFVDDNSTDGTLKDIQEISNRYPIQLFIKKEKHGKAFSLMRGFEMAKYNNVCMIDADLQYPPEVIPEMLNLIYENKADIVVANRKYVNLSLSRKIPSIVFKYIFGNLLHGLPYDIQSGLKVFRKEILEKFNLHSTPWTFDLEFLLKAKEHGYSVGQIDIQFLERIHGKAKVKVLKASYEIGIAAIKLKLSKIIFGRLNSEYYSSRGN